ncbi:MAG: PKD domain protein [halophilic archaeon J07HB67]|nr:MAG: PKD domain protein [halophilic archaeon J07HB67]
MQTRTTLTLVAVALLLAVPAVTAQLAGTERITNEPPQPEAGLDQTGVVGAPVYLDGGGSLDRDGEVVAHEWTVTPPDGTQQHRTGVRVQFTPAETGEYVVTLTVTDDDGVKRSDTAYVTVREPTTATPTPTATPPNNSPDGPSDSPTETLQQTETPTPTAAPTATPFPSLPPGGDAGGTVPVGPLLPTNPSLGVGNVSAVDTSSHDRHAGWQHTEVGFETTVFVSPTCVDCVADHDPQPSRRGRTQHHLLTVSGWA